jgi:uncharacterized protein YyaL (SSP411 family)
MARWVASQVMANRLAQETSPYLLQHAENPVNWQPWGEQALAEARAGDRPILVSIGYSACHWCHVMERESFEDPEVAAVMNEYFVCIKVDREERPDVDAIYMDAVQAMTGQGGWPLNMFLTPEQVPFYGGTYFPPEQAHGRPSWKMVLEAVAEAWTKRRDEIRTDSRRILEHLAGGAALRGSAEPIDGRGLDGAVEALRATYDPQRGGWGGAPKFPQASVIEFLLARGETEMSLGTLRAMAAGGIHDQVGGGFARYSVDANWTVPHFEKMLYDNALLARAYLHGWLVGGEDRMREVAVDTLDWLLQEMRGPEGGFYAALDADSEGVEGKYYVWTIPQLREALDGDGPLAAAAIEYFGVTPEGNFEGASILEARGPRPSDEDLAAIRSQLYAKREERVRPGLDDKRITAWNALAIAAFADAGAVLGREHYLDAAREAAAFVLDDMRDPDGRLLRTYSRGEARLGAYLEDHAFLLEALITLYEATFEERWFTEAVALARTVAERFADPEGGGFFSTPSDGEELIARRKELQDSPIPSGQASAALGLLRLAALTGEREHEQLAASALRLTHELALRHPAAFAHLLQAVAFYTGRTREVALVGPAGDPRAELERTVRSKLRPHLVLAGGEPAPEPAVPLLAGRELVDGRPAAYVCEDFACRQPVTGAEELETLLDAG